MIEGVKIWLNDSYIVVHMDIEYIRSYMFQGLLVIASMIHSLFPAGTSMIWNLILKLNGGWAQVVPVAVVLVLQLFGWQILRVLWFVLTWTFSSRNPTHKQAAPPISNTDRVYEVLIVTVRHLMDRINALEKNRIRQEDQINSLNERLFELKEKIASSSSVRHD